MGINGVEKTRTSATTTMMVLEDNCVSDVHEEILKSAPYNIKMHHEHNSRGPPEDFAPRRVGKFRHKKTSRRAVGK